MRLGLLALSFSLMACRTMDAASPPASLTTVSQLSDIAMPDCGALELQSETLMSTAWDTQEDFTGLPIKADGKKPLLKGPNDQLSIRLDICGDFGIDPAVVELKQVVLVGLEENPFALLPVNADSMVDGLSEAIFGDYSKLLVKIPYIPLGSSVTVTHPDLFQLRGSRNESANSEFATVAILRWNEAKNAYNSRQDAIMGYLTVGDIAGTSPCAGQANFVMRHSKIGSATFEFSICQGVGTSGTLSGTIIGLTITDTATALPLSLRGVPITIDPATLDQNVAIVLHHHNICDSMSIKTPKATYTFSAPHHDINDGSCSQSVPGAPISDKNRVTYTYTYGNGHKKSGKAPSGCAHHLWSCGI